MCLLNWYYYVILDLGLYFFGLLTTIIGVLIKRRLKRCNKTQNSVLDETGTNKTSIMMNEKDDNIVMFKRANWKIRLYKTYERLQNQLTNFISGENITGKLILSMACVCTMVSLGIYIYESTKYNLEIHLCNNQYKRRHLVLLDLACNCFFLIFFILRFISTDKKMSFWFNGYNIVDILTVPHSFMGLFPSFVVWWSGLRFLRGIWLIKLPDLLPLIFPRLPTTQYRLAHLCGVFLGVWVAGSGMVHLCETSGDLWEGGVVVNSSNWTPLSFGDCLYFSIVTMSTVGYGDISPKTTMGRVFVIVFIMVSIAMFASFIPEIYDILFSGSRYLGKYQPKSGMSHVVVCGNINYSSVLSFIDDFLHEDRPKTNLEVVFINPEEPSAELATLIRRNSSRVKYFKGTAMDIRDLQKVSIETATACMIIANSNSSDPQDEDSANIMRVISVKNYQPQLRILVQLLLTDSKANLMNIPAWDRDPTMGDEAICYSELQLGIIARSCLVPAYSAFITNLFSVRSERESFEYRIPVNHNTDTTSLSGPWINHYIDGVEMELYLEKLPHTLVNIAFSKLVLLAYRYLGLLVIGIENENDGTTKSRNQILINPSSPDITVPPNSSAYFICKSYRDIKRMQRFCQQCHGLDEKTCEKIDRITCKCCPFIKQIDNAKVNVEMKEKNPHTSLKRLTSTFFYETGKQQFSEKIIREPKENLMYANHILVLIFAETKSPFMGLKNFVQILRMKGLSNSEYRQIVFVGNEKFLKKEWTQISQFPNLQIVAADEITNDILRLVCTDKCHACILVGANTSPKSNKTSQSDFYLVDKEVILTSLNVQRLFNIDQPSTPPKDTPRTILISNIICDRNAQFLDQEDEDDPTCPLYLTPTFASGRAFTRNVLDSLMTIAFFNKDAIRFMQGLTNGNIDGQGRCSRLSTIKLAEDKRFNDLFNQTSAYSDNSPMIESIPLPGNLHQSTILYSELFEYAFEKYQLLPVGIYMEINNIININNNNNNNNNNNSSNRISRSVIITNPDSKLKIHRDRNIMILVLQPLA